MSHIEYPDYPTMKVLAEQVQSGNIALSLPDGVDIDIYQSLYDGGTKTVVDVLLDESRYALGLPNKPGHVETWLDHISTEQMMTDTVRSLGIPTNPVYEIVPVVLNGHLIPAAVMNRYEDLPFDVRDAKNTQSSIFRYPILDASPLTDIALMEHLTPLLDDVATLVRAGIQPKRSFHYMFDVFNVAVFPGGRCRLYLNDLGEAKQESISTVMAPITAEAYVRFTIDAFRWGVSLDEYEANMGYFDRLTQNIHSKLPDHPVYMEAIEAVFGAL